MTRRSLRLTQIDMSRIDALRDRCGPRATASEAVRAALVGFLALGSEADVSQLADSLARESEAADTAWTVWGIAMPEAEAVALDERVAHPPVGVRRRFSRNELVRLAVLHVVSLSNAVVAATYEGIPKPVRGRPAKGM